jgi:cytochrome c-type biogenesis protein CcmH/NrfF
MVENEHKLQFQSILSSQQDITRHLRASVIDWLFECSAKLKIEDKSVVF